MLNCSHLFDKFAFSPPTAHFLPPSIFFTPSISMIKYFVWPVWDCTNKSGSIIFATLLWYRSTVWDVASYHREFCGQFEASERVQLMSESILVALHAFERKLVGILNLNTLVGEVLGHQSKFAFLAASQHVLEADIFACDPTFLISTALTCHPDSSIYIRPQLWFQFLSPSLMQIGPVKTCLVALVLVP